MTRRTAAEPRSGRTRPARAVRPVAADQRRATAPRRAPASGRGAGPAGPQRRRLAQLAVPFALAAATVGVLAVGVYPTRAYLDKREQVREVEVELTGLRAANDDAAAFAELLDSDDEIERVARAELGLAKPGEETYVVLPPPAASPQVPDGWPFTKIDLRRNPSG